MNQENVKTSIDNRIIYFKLLKIQKKYKNSISQIKVDLYNEKYNDASKNIKVCMRYLKTITALLNQANLNDWFMIRYKFILMNMCMMICKLFIKPYTFKIYESIDLILDGISDLNDSNDFKSLMIQTIYFKFRLLNLSIIVDEIYDSERFDKKINKLKIKKMNCMVIDTYNKIQ